MKIRFVCVGDADYVIDFSSCDSLDELIEKIVSKDAKWIRDDIDHKAIQVDKIIAIMEETKDV